MSAADNSVSDVQYRQELDRVLNSDLFRNSGAVSKLLEFLGRKSLAGDESALKEFTIGVEAFGKPADYNPQLDPLVRVLASKLRHKLDDYYRTEGAANPIRIELPKGHYHLRFQPFEVRTEIVEPPQGNSDGRKWRWISYALMLALAGVATLALRWRPMPSSHPSFVAVADSADSEGLNLLWQPYMEGNRPTLIVFGTPLFTHFSGAFLRDPNVNQWEDASASERVRRVQDALRSPYAHPSYTFTGIGEANGILLLSRLLIPKKPGLMLRRSSSIGWDDIGAYNVIFLGPPKFNQHLKDMPFDQELTIERGNVINLKPRTGEPERYRATRTESHSAILEDYALMSRFPGLHDRGSVSILASSSTEGTWAAAEYATAPQHVKDLVARLRDPSGRLPDAFQVLIRAKFKDQVPIAISYITHRVLKASGARPHK